LPPALLAQRVAYIYGDVAADGTIPSGAAPAFHQMLLTDTGGSGCSMFKAMVEAEGYSINQFYDQATTLNEAFLSQHDVIVFGLHQKVWSAVEKAALHNWMMAGGGILMYSDSAAGGNYQIVGIHNTVGQTAVNNVLTPYGLQVTVDQSGGTRAYTSSPTDDCNPIVWDQPEIEGEGVSPVAVDLSTGAKALIPFEDSCKVSGTPLTIDARNITIANPRWAALAHRRVGNGNIIAMFDRQPMWNSGVGSSIQQRDNREILRRVVMFLARDYANSPEWFNVKPAMRIKPADGQPYLEVSYRQWRGGSGTVGVDYLAHNSEFRVEYSPNLQPGSWVAGTNIVEQVGPAVDNGDGTEFVTVRVVAENGNSPMGFARATVSVTTCRRPLGVKAGNDVYIGETGTAWLHGIVTGYDIISTNWSKLSGPGSVAFANATSAVTTATFSLPGIYELALTAEDGTHQVTDTVLVRVVRTNDVVRAINCGGSEYVGTNGFTYQADAFYTAGHIDAFPGNAVPNTADDLLYNYARSKHSAYTIPVANGNYLVLLQFAETYYTSPSQRVFNVAIEGVQVLPNFDVYAAAGGKWMAYDRAFATAVSDGQLDVTFTGVVGNSLLNALVVINN
jgi:hypothetical protein